MLKPDSHYPAAEAIAETLVRAYRFARLYIDALRLGTPNGRKAPVANDTPR